MKLVTKVYQKSTDFPGQEAYGLTNQIRRSVISIPSNIAEGFGRNHSKEYIRFLEILRGSLYELQTQIEIAFNLNYLLSDDFTQLSILCTEIVKMLKSLIRNSSSNGGALSEIKDLNLTDSCTIFPLLPFSFPFCFTTLWTKFSQIGDTFPKWASQMGTYLVIIPKLCINLGMLF